MKFKFSQLCLPLALSLAAAAFYGCSNGKGNGTRDLRPSFADRGSPIDDGNKNQNPGPTMDPTDPTDPIAKLQFQDCTGLEDSDLAKALGFLTAEQQQSVTDTICKALSTLGFKDGPSLTKQPSDI